MKTVNSLFGRKTSSYIAVHYPADIFLPCAASIAIMSGYRFTGR